MYINNDMMRAYTRSSWGAIMEQESFSARVKIDPSSKSNYWHRSLTRWIKRGFADRLTGEVGATFLAIMKANNARYVAHMNGNNSQRLSVTFYDRDDAEVFIKSLPDTIALGKLIRAAAADSNHPWQGYHGLHPYVRMCAPGGDDSYLGKLFIEVCNHKSSSSWTDLSDSFERWITTGKNEVCTLRLDCLTYSKSAAHTRKILSVLPHPLQGTAYERAMKDLNAGAMYDYKLKVESTPDHSSWDVYDMRRSSNA